MSEFTNESVAQIEATLNEVDRALERLRPGSYRTCQVCGSAIDEATSKRILCRQLHRAPRTRLALIKQCPVAVATGHLC